MGNNILHFLWNLCQLNSRVFLALLTLGTTVLSIRSHDFFVEKRESAELLLHLPVPQLLACPPRRFSAGGGFPPRCMLHVYPERSRTGSTLTFRHL